MISRPNEIFFPLKWCYFPFDAYLAGSSYAMRNLILEPPWERISLMKRVLHNECISSFRSLYFGKKRLPQRFLSILIGPIISKPMKWDKGSWVIDQMFYIFKRMHFPKKWFKWNQKKCKQNKNVKNRSNEKNGKERDWRMHFNLQQFIEWNESLLMHECRALVQFELWFSYTIVVNKMV